MASPELCTIHNAQITRSGELYLVSVKSFKTGDPTTVSVGAWDTKEAFALIDTLDQGAVLGAGTDAVGAFFEGMGHYRLLKPEEVIKLFFWRDQARYELKQRSTHLDYNPQMKAHINQAEVFVRQAENVATCANLRLVTKFARAKSDQEDPMDILSAGTMGLMHGVKKFDYTRGIRFATYAAFWIKQAVQRHRDEPNQAINYPRSHIAEMRKHMNLRALFVETFGFEPNAEELAGYANVNVELIERSYKIARGDVRLDTPVENGTDPSDTTMADFMGDRRYSPEERLGLSLDITEIHTLFDAAGLTEVERRVIRASFGIGQSDQKTQNQIGAAGTKIVTGETVRRQKNGALKKLRAAIQENPHLLHD